MTATEWAALREYLHLCATQGNLSGPTKPADPSLRARAKHLVPRRFRTDVRLILTDVVAPWQRRKAARYARMSPLLLYVGSGAFHKDRWVNIDLVGAPVEVAWNVSRPLPFANNTVDGIFHEHLLEHLPLRVGIPFMRDCWRILKPGGVLRVAVPDAGRLLRSYAGDGEQLESLRPGRPTRLLAAQEQFYWYGHRTMFDTDTLIYLFRAAGFPAPNEREFGQSSLPGSPDSEYHRAASLYVEAQK